MRVGKFSHALNLLEKSLEMKITVNDQKGIGFARYYIGLIHLYLGEIEKAEAEVQPALTVWREEVKDKRGEGYCLYGLGLIALAKEDYEEAESYLNQANKLSEELVLKAEIIESLSFLAVAYLGLEKLEEALKVSTRAIMQLETQKDVEEIQQIYFNHYKVLLANGDETAGDFLNKACEILTAQRDLLTSDEDKQAYEKNVPVNREILAANC
jgi:tetratricopeptide (TPR) repeat protein